MTYKKKAGEENESDDEPDHEDLNEEDPKMEESVIQLTCRPLKLFISFESLKKLMTIFTSGTEQKSKQKLDELMNLERVRQLRANLLNLPLSYFKEKLEHQINQMVRFQGNIDKISAILYDASGFIGQLQIMELKLKNINIYQKMPKKEHFSRTEGAFIQTSVVANSIQLNLNSSKHKQKEMMLKTGVHFKFKKNLVQNHALLTDTIVDIFIPFLKINFPKVPFDISRLINCLFPEVEPKQTKKKMDAHLKMKVMKGLQNDVEKILKELYETDHHQGKKKKLNPCRHCILKHKKSVLKLRVVIGYLSEDSQELSEFDNASKQISTEKGIHIMFPIPAQNRKTSLDESKAQDTSLGMRKKGKQTDRNKNGEDKDNTNDRNSTNENVLGNQKNHSGKIQGDTKDLSQEIFRQYQSFRNNRKSHHSDSMILNNFNDYIQIYAPYINFIRDEGLFREYMTVHCSKIYAINQLFSFDIVPYWKLTHKFILKDLDKSLLQNYWSLCLNYENQISKSEGYASYKSKILKEGVKLLEPNNENGLSQNNKDDIFLLYLQKSWVNKRFLCAMEKPDASNAHLMSYKDLYMSRIQRLHLSGHEMFLMAYIVKGE